MSNAERQRQFLQRHPNYYANRRRRLQAERAARMAAAEAAAATRATPLMLPAPVQMPLFPGLNDIPATMAELRERQAERSAVEVR